MFISTNQLVRSYGIDDKIARFFVDREPPADNLYWFEKLLYLRPAPGYLFIPLIVDLLFKVGIDKENLLSEEFVGAMEQVGHISALEETKNISEEEAIRKCDELIKSRGRNEAWLQEVNDYFSGKNESNIQKLKTPYKALHRGDIFLYSLSTLHFPASLFTNVAELWFALISTLLLLDDAEDIEADKNTGDDNAFIESGLSADGLQQISHLVERNVSTISTLNAVMAAELARQSHERFQQSDILELLNH